MSSILRMSGTDAAAPHGSHDLPPSLAVRREGEIAVVTLSRPHKRNAIDDATLLGLERSSPPRPRASGRSC